MKRECNFLININTVNKIPNGTNALMIFYTSFKGYTPFTVITKC